MTDRHGVCGLRELEHGQVGSRIGRGDLVDGATVPEVKARRNLRCSCDIAVPINRPESIRRHRCSEVFLVV
jgi:hypothetical protein